MVEIYYNTEFLDNAVSIGIRAKHILDGIAEILKCNNEYCDNNVSWNPITSGYCNHCSIKKVAVKFVDEYEPRTVTLYANKMLDTGEPFIDVSFEYQ